MKKIDPVSCLAFLIVTYVSRNAIPYIVYPFMVLLFSFTLFQIINCKNVKQVLLQTVTTFFPVVFLITIEIIALFSSSLPILDKQIDILKDIIFISFFLFLLTQTIRSKEDFTLLVVRIGKYFIIFSIIVAILGIWKFFYSPTFLSYMKIDGIQRFKWGSSLVSDYNYFSLFLLTGLIFGLHKLLGSQNKIKYKALFLTALQLIIVVGVLAGSRRFYFCSGFFVLVCLFLLIPYIFRKIFSNLSSYKCLVQFLGSSFLTLGIIYIFLSYYPVVSEKMEKISFNDADKTNINIVLVSSRINSAFSSRIITTHTAAQDSKLKSQIEKQQLVLFTESRRDLWDLGIRIYKEYSVPKKIYGGDFSFMKTFKNETNKHKYPHHLFISVLLFCGIVGLIVYLSVLIWSAIIYLLHLKKLYVFFFLFVLNFIFGFFSYTDFFGASFYALLFLLPFLYMRLQDNEKNVNIKYTKIINKAHNYITLHHFFQPD
ncbi:MAG: hypothetical protein LBI45_08275 [Bacteroidales bacterium]|nr:hypothetical protein [Bacteroidales bacterium]